MNYVVRISFPFPSFPRGSCRRCNRVRGSFRCWGAAGINCRRRSYLVPWQENGGQSIRHCVVVGSDVGRPFAGQTMLALAPWPDFRRRFADPSGNIVGSKLCTGAPIGPNFFCFILFIFLLFSSYSSLHISYYSSLLIFKLFVVLQTCKLNTHWTKVHK